METGNAMARKKRKLPLAQLPKKRESRDPLQLIQPQPGKFQAKSPPSHGTINHPMKDESKQIDASEPRIDRSAFSVFSSFEEADAADKAYWLSRTPEERVSHVEFLRRINYGDRASERLQRVLEIVTRARR